MGKIVTFRTTEEYFARIKRIAGARGMSVTALIFTALQPIIDETRVLEGKVSELVNQGWCPPDSAQPPERIIALALHGKEHGLSQEVVREQIALLDINKDRILQAIRERQAAKREADASSE